MIDLILHLFLAAFWIFGVRTLFSHDHLFEKVYTWAEKNLSEYVLKPTIGCPLCMASVHGIAWYFLFMWPMYEWYFFPIFCICLCGLNTIIDNIMSPQK